MLWCGFGNLLGALGRTIQEVQDCRRRLGAIGVVLWGSGEAPQSSVVL